MNSSLCPRLIATLATFIPVSLAITRLDMLGFVTRATPRTSRTIPASVFHKPHDQLGIDARCLPCGESNRETTKRFPLNRFGSMRRFPRRARGTSSAIVPNKPTSRLLTNQCFRKTPAALGAPPHCAIQCPVRKSFSWLPTPPVPRTHTIHECICAITDLPPQSPVGLRGLTDSSDTRNSSSIWL